MESDFYKRKTMNSFKLSGKSSQLRKTQNVAALEGVQDLYKVAMPTEKIYQRGTEC